MNRYTTTLVLVAAMLGCGGLMGYGKEVGFTTATNAAPFSLSYTPATNLPHQVWLDYDLTLNGDWKVTGNVDAATSGASAGTWTLDFTSDGSPIVGGSGRVTLNSFETNVNGSGSAKGTIYLFEIPGQPTGTPVDVTGTFTAGPSTTINSLRLVVTD